MNTVVTIIIGYLVGFVITSIFVRLSISLLDPNYRNKGWKKLVDTGLIIGLCETFLTITFILLKEYTALAIIFTAKSIVRSKKMEEKPEYYLVGTIVNFTIAVLSGVILRLLILKRL